MATENVKILLRRGLRHEITAATLDTGEMGFAYDTNQLYIGIDRALNQIQFDPFINAHAIIQTWLDSADNPEPGLVVDEDLIIRNINDIDNLLEAMNFYTQEIVFSGDYSQDFDNYDTLYQRQYIVANDETSIAIPENVGDAGIVKDKVYKILSLGDTDWNELAGTTGVTYSVNDKFVANYGVNVTTANITTPAPGRIVEIINVDDYTKGQISAVVYDSNTDETTITAMLAEHEYSFVQEIAPNDNYYNFQNSEFGLFSYDKINETWNSETTTLLEDEPGTGNVLAMDPATKIAAPLDTYGVVGEYAVVASAPTGKITYWKKEDYGWALLGKKNEYKETELADIVENSDIHNLSAAWCTKVQADITANANVEEDKLRLFTSEALAEAEILYPDFVFDPQKNIRYAEISDGEITVKQLAYNAVTQVYSWTIYNHNHDTSVIPFQVYDGANWVNVPETRPASVTETHTLTAGQTQITMTQPLNYSVGYRVTTVDVDGTVESAGSYYTLSGQDIILQAPAVGGEVVTVNLTANAFLKPIATDLDTVVADKALPLSTFGEDGDFAIITSTPKTTFAKKVTGAWVQVGDGDPNLSVNHEFTDTAPATPLAGDTWTDTTQLVIYQNDADKEGEIVVTHTFDVGTDEERSEVLEDSDYTIDFAANTIEILNHNHACEETDELKLEYNYYVNDFQFSANPPVILDVKDPATQVVTTKHPPKTRSDGVSSLNEGDLYVYTDRDYVGRLDITISQFNQLKPKLDPTDPAYADQYDDAYIPPYISDTFAVAHAPTSVLIYAQMPNLSEGVFRLRKRDKGISTAWYDFAMGPDTGLFYFSKIKPGSITEQDIYTSKTVSGINDFKASMFGAARKNVEVVTENSFNQMYSDQHLSIYDVHDGRRSSLLRKIFDTTSGTFLKYHKDICTTFFIDYSIKQYNTNLTYLRVGTLKIINGAPYGLTDANGYTLVKLTDENTEIWQENNGQYTNVAEDDEFSNIVFDVEIDGDDMKVTFTQDADFTSEISYTIKRWTT